MTGGELDVTEGHSGVETGNEPGSPSDGTNPAMGGSPVQALARGTAEDRPLRPLAHGQVDHPGGSRHKRDDCGLGALAHDPKSPVTSVEPQVLDVGAAGLAHPQTVQAEQDSEGPMGVVKVLRGEEEPSELGAAPKEPDVRFSLIRLSDTSSPDGMHGAVPDASHQTDEPQVLVVDHDTQAVVATMMAVLLRDEEDENSRVTLLVGMDETENTEAATILSCMERICATRLAGRIQCLITDMIIRGKHMVPLYRRCGVIPVTKVAAASDDGSSEDGEDGVPSGGGRSDNEQEKTAKKLQLGTQSHVLPNGKECKHMLSRVDGALVEVDFNEDGSELIEVGRPALLQVKRSVSNSSEEPFRFNEQYLIECPDGAFTFFLCPHKSHNGDDGRHVAENSRIFPERSEVFTSLYGSGRNTSEGGNAQMKDAYPHKRSQASGRLPVLLDAYLYFVVDNAKTWYFQSGWEVVDPLVHVSDVDTLAG